MFAEWGFDDMTMLDFGMHIMVSEYALKDTDQRLFPVSRHRSKRVRKKLVRRFGGEFKRVPCIFQTPRGLIAHPVMYDQLKRELQAHHA